ncbi:MAG: type I CRISPR-associated protein Cas7 [Massilimicrobiota timonensis]
MNKRVHGVLGISSIMANWNADFTGYPKTISTGEIFGSDKAFKYPMKKQWDNNGEKVLYIKSMILSKDKDAVSLVPRTLKERYEYLFGIEDLSKCKDVSEVLKNLFTAVDVKNFGATFAEAKMNISITGAVQFGQGFNKYPESEAQEQQILSPFKDGTDADAKNSTLGTKIVSDEAHYFYPFVINPHAYDEFVKLGVTDGYTEGDYLQFKDTSLSSATAFATNSKEGCENEFGLFVETEPTLYLPNLTEYIEFKKGKDKNTISIHLRDLLEDVKSKVLNIEVYYNPHTTMIDCDLSDVHYYHIVTRKEV